MRGWMDAEQVAEGGMTSGFSDVPRYFAMTLRWAALSWEPCDLIFPVSRAATIACAGKRRSVSGKGA
jgi:hypothetical protein